MPLTECKTFRPWLSCTSINCKQLWTNFYVLYTYFSNVIVLYSHHSQCTKYMATIHGRILGQVMLDGRKNSVNFPNLTSWVRCPLSMHLAFKKSQWTQTIFFIFYLHLFQGVKNWAKSGICKGCLVSLFWVISKNISIGIGEVLFKLIVKLFIQKFNFILPDATTNLSSCTGLQI